jgi:hypothetical protein
LNGAEIAMKKISERQIEEIESNCRSRMAFVSQREREVKKKSSDFTVI